MAALLTALFGLIVGLGSYIRFPVVSWWVLGILPSPLTALALAFGGVSLAVFVRARRLDGPARAQALAIARGLAAIVMGFGLLVVAMFVAGYDLPNNFRLTPIDRLHTYSPTSTRPLVGGCFFLLGSGLLAIGTKHSGRRIYAHATIGLVGFCSVLAVLCAEFDRRLFLGHESAGPVSYLTSVAFLVLCLGYYFLETDAGLVSIMMGSSTGATVARRLLPAAFIVPPLVAWTSRYAEQKGLYPSAVGEGLEALVNILVFTALICWTAVRLFEADAERKKAELSMRESEERFSEAFQHSPIGVALVSREGRWLKINPALCELVGYTEEEMLTKKSDELTHPDDRAVDEEGRRRMLANQLRNYQVEKRYIHISGRIITVLVSVSLIRDEEGKGRHFIAQIQDITERKRTEDALRESEARYQRIAANVPGMVYRFVERADGTRVLLFASEGCREIYGVDPQQLQKDPTLIVQSIHPDDQQDYLRSISISAATLSAWNWQGRVKRHNTGEVRSIQGASRPERHSNGDITWDGVIVDITERKQAEEDRRAKEEAERTNLAKSKFLSRMSHELRTPLNAILGFGQLLQLSSLSEDDTIALDYILKGGNHLLSLIDEVLDLSRAEAGELRLHAGPVELNAIARECVGLVTRLSTARGIQCTVIPANPSIVLWTDEQRLRQIVLNLISNAIKYNREGGRVTVECELRPEQRARINVTDTGEGLTPEGLGKLFVPFERLEQESGAIEGTGLGLVVSRRIAEALNGSVGVRSEPGVGSTFWIELPVTSAPVPPAFDLAAPITPADVPILGTTWNRRILYVEDNASNMYVVRMLLSRRRPRWEFHSAVNGRSGIEQARLLNPDVILLDYQLPDLQGDEVLATLRRNVDTSHIPVIILSADATSHSRERLLGAGAEGYISKPFVTDTLLRALDEILATDARSQEQSTHARSREEKFLTISPSA